MTESDGQTEEEANRSKLIIRLKEAGKEIFTNKVLYSVTDELTRPIMLPPCPVSQFIDKFPTNSKKKAEATASKKQAQYEGEVEVFRALERLEHPLFIMHSFKYTHQQYALFVDHECTKTDTQDEGEADFVAVQDDLIAIYEVKAVEAFEINYKKSREQLEKTSVLIKNICRKVGSFEPQICKYTVFTNLDRTSAEKIKKYSSLSDLEKSEILLKDELDNGCNNGIGKCFEREIDVLTRDFNDYVMNPSYIKAKLLWILLGLWNADVRNEFDMDKWDLGRTINSVDELLKNASISSQPAGPKSSKVKGSPPELKELGILCFTEEQKKVFYSENQRIVINGPAGSGKTLLILGKIIQLARKSGGLITVVVPSGLTADWYETNLNKSGISSVRKLTKDKTIDRYKVFILNIEDYKFNRGGFVNVCAEGRIMTFCQILCLDSHIFIDDFHAFDFAFRYYPKGSIFADLQKNGYNYCDFWEVALAELRENSKKTFWICYDSLQTTFHGNFEQQLGSIEKWESENTVLKLSANLRNSYEIADFIWFLRQQRLDNIEDCLIQGYLMAKSNDRNLKPFDVEQEIGHFIHGPSPRTNWVDLHGRGVDRSEYLVNFLINEVVNILNCQKVAVVHDDYGDPVKNYNETFETEPPDELKQRLEKMAAIDPIKLDEICQRAKETVNSEFKDCKMDLKVFHMDEVVSAEWPAVIGILKVHEKYNIALDLEHNEFTRGFYKFIDKPLHYEVIAKQDPIDRLLAKMNAIVSRARSYCVLICVFDEEEPFLEYKTLVKKECDDNEHYFDAARLRCYGNTVVNKLLYGELEESSRMTACDEIEFTKEQLQSLIKYISLIEVPIRLPKGKMVQPKVLAERVASSYGLQVNYGECKQKINLNPTDEQLAIYFRNRRKTILHPNRKELMKWSHVFAISKYTYLPVTKPASPKEKMNIGWQIFVREMEAMGLLRAEDRSDVMKLGIDVAEQICSSELIAFLENHRRNMEESGLQEGNKTERWRRFRSASAIERYKLWVKIFISKRYSRILNDLNKNYPMD